MGKLIKEELRNMKIFITGCAKTGTTLVRRLFQAYDLKVCPYEISLINFLASDWDVAKRTYDSILSNELSLENIEEAKLIEKENIKLINVVRNKQDTLSSSNCYVSVGRYTQSVIQAAIFRDLITYTVRFEDLIESPDSVQNEVSHKIMLMPRYKWSEYPKFVDLKGERFKDGQYRLRGLGEK